MTAPGITTAAITTAGITAADWAFRHNPDDWPATLPRRHGVGLAPEALPAGMAVMLDTSVYISRLRNRLPPAIIACIDARPVRHSAVACAEMAIGAGLLAPAHPATPRNRAAIARLLAALPETDIVAPDPAAWTEAGMIAGILARTQHGAAGADGRRRLLNDALLFLSARAAGAALISADHADMGRLAGFDPAVPLVLFAP